MQGAFEKDLFSHSARAWVLYPGHTLGCSLVYCSSPDSPVYDIKGPPPDATFAARIRAIVISMSVSKAFRNTFQPKPVQITAIELMMGKTSASHSPGSGRRMETYTYQLRDDLGGQPSIASHGTS